MEIVSGPGDDAQPVTVTAESIALLRQGKLRVRQRPRPKNALGLVKFVFPNDYNVYLHGTPAPHQAGPGPDTQAAVSVTGLRPSQWSTRFEVRSNHVALERVSGPELVFDESGLERPSR